MCMCVCILCKANLPPNKQCPTVLSGSPPSDVTTAESVCVCVCAYILMQIKCMYIRCGSVYCISELVLTVLRCVHVYDYLCVGGTGEKRM